MYASSSSQKSISQTGLTRYGSAPGSLLTNAVDAVIGPSDRDFSLAGPRHPFFSGDSSDSVCKLNSSSSSDPKDHHHHHQPPPQPRPAGGLQRSIGLNEAAAAAVGFGGSALLRQRSSPAGFLSHLTADNGRDTLVFFIHLLLFNY